MTEDCSDPVVIPAICPSQCHVPACTEASSTAVSGSPSTRKAKKISQDELESLRKNLDDAKAECFDLEKQKCDAVCHLKACRAEMDKEIKRRGKAERETEEVRMEYIKLKQTELMRRKESEKAALEREAETIKEIQYLADQLALLREDSNKRIKAIETTSKNDAEYNFGVIQKLESSNSQRDQKHLEETEALRSQLQAEIDSLKSKKCNLMMEVEKQKTNTKLIEQLLANQQQVLQQEKEAIEQELKHQVSVQMVEIECLQHRLDDKDRELAKINQVYHHTEG
uniref:Uncharacterized protein n=1 Tax=Physcomitrium patens TaxID=3218 RepID=A0A2K1L1L6_PHYPA|nr:hypothetical protein PHYPA_002710 [Physcomitrium patens]